MEGSIICLSKDDSYRQICSLNRVHVPSDYSLRWPFVSICQKALEERPA